MGKYLMTKWGEKPTVRELWHGTNNNMLDTLYTHGLQPPSDTAASDLCTVSGKKGLHTTLCNNTCKHYTERHEWNRCHMYGLGIYLADLSNKSHRYCSQPKIVNGCKRYHMVLCSVVGRAWKLEGHLTRGDVMHDVPTNRMLQAEDVQEMIQPCCFPGTNAGHSCPVSGVGANIRGVGGDLWGRCVADEGHCWRLDSGRIAKKMTEG